ncbi:hypothetical protein ES319_D12G101800v1 [Gossypium barbadense]|uniref:Secreted protein n=1 Tax=Gossypium barbadense TaxID=3634 RepID=A0A5J5NXF0_GOSBA|nr:hypothetical protein ES319_D12G101800v1 [Gossypium barbadense]
MSTPLFVCCLSFVARLFVSYRYEEQGWGRGLYGGKASSGGARTKARRPAEAQHVSTKALVVAALEAKCY